MKIKNYQKILIGVGCAAVLIAGVWAGSQAGFLGGEPKSVVSAGKSVKESESAKKTKETDESNK